MMMHGLANFKLDDSVCELFVYVYSDFGRFQWEGLCSAVVMCLAPLRLGSSFVNNSKKIPAFDTCAITKCYYLLYCSPPSTCILTLINP